MKLFISTTADVAVHNPPEKRFYIDEQQAVIINFD